MQKKIILLLSLFLINACSTPPQKIYNAEVQYPEYVIGNNDYLRINVWKNADLSVDVPVRPDGKISVPLVGDAQAQGLTAEELAKQLTEKLSKYIRQPNVTVIVTQANSSAFLNRVRITGAVNNPLSLPYRRNMTVLDLVLQAGGLTAFANADDAILYRKTPKGTIPYKVNIDEILHKGILTTNYELRPFDILIIPESIF
jgi:polysaccharide export outer membrane protein